MTLILSLSRGTSPSDLKMAKSSLICDHHPPSRQCEQPGLGWGLATGGRQGAAQSSVNNFCCSPQLGQGMPFCEEARSSPKASQVGSTGISICLFFFFLPLDFAFLAWGKGWPTRRKQGASGGSLSQKRRFFREWGQIGYEHVTWIMPKVRQKTERSWNRGKERGSH